MSETMHHDTNANLYPMHTFLKSMHRIVNFYGDAPMWIVNLTIPGLHHLILLSGI